MALDVNSIVAELDTEIAHLQSIRAALAGKLESAAPAKKRGRPAGSKNASAATASAPKKRTMSLEGRKRLAEGMKKRWAA